MSPKTPSDLDLHMARLLREARAKAGLSIQAVADKIGVSYQQYSKIEHGVNRITIGRLFAVADALDVDIQILIAACKAYKPTAVRVTSTYGNTLLAPPLKKTSFKQTTIGQL